jgi:predicted RNA-binding protein with EMAP domain
MAEYKIVVANKDVEEFTKALTELPYDTDIQYTRSLMFARSYTVNLTEEDYVYLSLKFKFLKPTVMRILKI